LEVHERTLDGDFLLVLLKALLAKRRDLKLVMMSATVDAELFQNYFKGCVCCHIEGRTFPVRDHYLDDFMNETGYYVSPTGKLLWDSKG